MTSMEDTGLGAANHITAWQYQQFIPYIIPTIQDHFTENTCQRAENESGAATRKFKSHIPNLNESTVTGF